MEYKNWVVNAAVQDGMIEQKLADKWLATAQEHKLNHLKYHKIVDLNDKDVGINIIG